MGVDRLGAGMAWALGGSGLAQSSKLFTNSVLSVFGLTVMCSLMVVLFVASSWSDYEAGKRRLEEDAKVKAVLLRDKFDLTLTTVDRLLAAVSRKVQAEGIEHFAGAAGRAYLREIAEAMPMEGIVWVIRPDGKPVAASRQSIPEGMSVTDRVFFQEIVAGRTDLVITEPFPGKVVSGTIIPVARGVRDADGKLIAIVSIGVVPRAIEDSFRSFVAGGNIVALRLTSGQLLLRVPGADRNALNPVNSPLATLLADQRDGAFLSLSLVDNQERMHGFARLDRYPVIALAGVSSRDWLAQWRINTAWRCGWLVLGLALAAALYVSLLHRVRAEQKYGRRLEAVSQAKSQFLAAASHDLRQPVQALRLFWEVLAANDAVSPQPAFRKLGETIGVAEDLLNTLLQISALDAGVIQPKPEPARLGDILDKVCGPLQRGAERKGLRLRVVDSTAIVQTDPTLLGQILSNLVGNAIKYTDSGKILVGCRRRHGGIAIQVLDSGRGIPADKLDVIFSEFVQLDNPQRDRTKGLGLGLSIVHRTAALLGYGLDVVSREGHGSCFTVTIPPAAAPASGHP